MNEIMFVVEESQDGGYCAKAVGASIITEADSMEELKANISDAVKCHFNEEDKPKYVHLYVTREETFNI